MVLPEPSASVAEPTIQSTKLAEKEAPKTQKLESNTQQTTMKPTFVDGDHQYNSIIAVAIDKDKNSQHAVKWAVENLLKEKLKLTLIHVRTRNLGQHTTEVPLESSQQIESDIKQLFLTFRGFCARRGIHLKEVLLDDMDVSDALLGYINKHSVTSIVVGTSTRNMITRRIRNPDVQSSLVKLAPEFCAVFVINSKGKAVTVRQANRPPPVSGTSPKSSANTMGLPPHHHNDYGVIEDAIRTPARGTNWRNAAGRQNNNYNNDFVRMGSRDHKNNSVPRSSISSSLSVDGGFDPGMFTPRMSNVGPDSFTLTDDIDLTTGSFSNNNLKLPWDFSTVDANAEISMISSSSSSSQSSIEAEMKRLKLELDHTMELYSTACREAITAKQKAAELAQWKMDESRRFEEAKQAEEAALKLAMVEKAKYKAALEAAQKVAESEAKKRWEAESKAQQQQQQLQSEERSQVLCTLAKADLLYRKYSIEEISRATNNFTPLLRIGEGGYGPVYRGRLDHTQVAIKVLRPDAAQGMKQFNQEVEVLSCIRHPNMVLLLGACPEYGCLVYEYMDNGSLDDRLFRKGNSPPIPWQIRFKIAAEIATGLLFLHQTKPEPLVHRDLKPGNILLDHNYVSKISDVGLARLVPASIADSVTQYHMTSAAGTFCYIDPEYQQTGMLGTKSDIYSLGILLLQIITAKPPMGLSHHVERSIDKGTFEEILDPSVQDWPIEAVLSFAKIALKCAELRKKDRPDLGTVILPELNRLREFGESEGSNFHDFNNHGPMPFNRSLQLRSGNEPPGSNFNIGHPQWSSSTEICMYLPPIEENEEERFFPSKLLDTDNSEE